MARLHHEISYSEFNHLLFDLPKASSMSSQNNLLKRFLYQLRVNFLPTILMLIFILVIAMYFSELIEKAKSSSNDYNPAQTSKTRPTNTDAHTLVSWLFL
jgi:hypothetical protein